LKTILTEKELGITIRRLSHQLLENHLQFDDVVVIGIQPRGIFFSDRIVREINQQISPAKITYGKLDITFFRDDIRKGLHALNQTDILFSVENKTVILVDDVLYTGRTIRAAMDALQAFGRPAKVELCILIDRRFNLTSLTLKALEGMSEKYGIPVLPPIRTDGTVPKAERVRKFLFDMDPHCKAAEDYRVASAKLMELLNVKPRYNAQEEISA